jgi:pantoate--beta-alanine ligase
MILFKKTAALRKWLAGQQEKQCSVGFVPTMGALHKGHISLIDASKKQNTITISSIFVNPAQFNDAKDFEKYPITLEQDIAQLEEAGCDVLFLPGIKEIYPNGIKPARHYNLDFLETILEGKFRPGHFQGVCMVVHRLLEIVQPDNLYLGQKDYQQCMVITKLIELIKPEKTINVTICPTLRETDGLAMSSRNMRLTKQERKKAAAIFQSLQLVKRKIVPGNLSSLKEEGQSVLLQEGFTIDYFEIADAKDLSKVNDWDGQQQLVVIVAAFMNEVRLIDNMVLG